MKLYHYTIGLKLNQIRKTGCLLCFPERPPFPEKPILWFSSNKFYEPTAVKSVMTPAGGKTLSMSETEAYGGGLFRFVLETDSVSVRLYPWEILKSVAKLKKMMRQRLVDRAKACGSNPKEWYGSLEAISLDVLSVEQFVGGAWVKRDMATCQMIESDLNVVCVKGSEHGVKLTADSWSG